VQRWIGDLNRAYRDEPALHDLDISREGFQWIDGRDIEASVLSFLRVSERGELVLVVGNFTPVVRDNYRIGVPRGGRWRELLNSDAGIYGGSGVGNFGGADAAPLAAHGRPFSLTLVLPPLAIVMFKAESAQ
jgi:1,4-alpha-glucan branching enzyme